MRTRTYLGPGVGLGRLDISNLKSLVTVQAGFVSAISEVGKGTLGLELLNDRC